MNTIVIVATTDATDLIDARGQINRSEVEDGAARLGLFDLRVTHFRHGDNGEIEPAGMGDQTADAITTPPVPAPAVGVQGDTVEVSQATLAEILAGLNAISADMAKVKATVYGGQ